MHANLEKFLLGFIPLFVAIDPLGLVPLFLGMTGGMDAARRRRLAHQATWVATIVAIVFMFLGKFIFRALGITADDFKIAGGLILFILASGDLTGHDPRSTLAGEEAGIVPLGLPLIAGPAMLTTLLVLVETIGAPFTLLALLTNMLLLYLALEYCELLARWIGKHGLQAFSKIIALLLAAIAISMIRQGVQSIWKS